MSKDTPIEPRPDAKPRVAQIIDLAGVRIEWGIPRFRAGRCEHKSLVYCQTERRIWCRDCEQTIENFSGFMTLVNKFQEMLRAINSQKTKAEEALKATLTRRAAKKMDRDWGAGMAPCCPHCNKALLPEDVEKVGSSINAEWERTRRAHRKPGGPHA